MSCEMPGVTDDVGGGAARFRVAGGNQYEPRLLSSVVKVVNIATFSGAWPDSCRGACTCSRVSSALSRRRDRSTKLGVGLAFTQGETPCR